MPEDSLKDVRKTLNVWYLSNKRDLPWRDISDPFFIWLSEIILQQTRVSQGMAYYLQFCARFPDVHTLANASLDEVLKLWQGLGYYSRARNLHEAARYISNHLNGLFPDSYEVLRNIKGIGDYTAAAIASLAFNRPCAVVDGNVNRVISRLFGVTTPIDTAAGRKQIHDLANRLLDRQNPGTHNQALMEFGAIHCMPKTPRCAQCPLSDRCYAFANGKQADLPVKRQKKVPEKRFFNYFIVTCNGAILLRKRQQDDIWKGLYEFPMFESRDDETWESLIVSAHKAGVPESSRVIVNQSIGPIKHVLTHQTIYARALELQISPQVQADLPGQIWVDMNDLQNYAVPRLVERIIEQCQLIQSYNAE